MDNKFSVLASISPVIELRHLRCFNVVVSVMNFTRAAELMNLGQSALSKTIKQLEDELGAELFERDTRRVRLTNAGKMLAREVDSVLKSLEHALLETQLLKSGDHGVIKVGVTESALAGPLSSLLSKFICDHPAYQFLWKELPAWEKMSTWLDTGRLDIAFLYSPPDELEKRGISGIPLLPIEQSYVALPPGHPLLSKSEVSIDDIEKEVLILKQSNAMSTVQRFYAKRSPTVRLILVNSDRTALGLVALGAGLALTMKFPNDREADQINYRPLKDVKVATCGYWAPENKNPALRQLVDYIQQSH